MPRNAGTGLSRRFVLTASIGLGGLVVPRWIWAESSNTPRLHWKLEESGDLAVESATGTRDQIASRTGHAIWVGQGRNRALRLDGYSVYFRHNAFPGVLRGNAMTVTAWVALESYPVNEAALLELDTKSNTAFRFSIDRLGFLQFGHHPADAKSICKSPEPVPRGQWMHLAATVSDSGISLYKDGALFAQLPSARNKSKLPENTTFVLGGATGCPMSAETFPTGVINGLLRDVRVYNGELTQTALAEIMQDAKPDAAPDLEINGPWCVRDPHRPIAHALPPRAWTNEPHGLIHWDGHYHLFYQKNPNGPYWGHLQWGHMTSPDLVQWAEMPVAIHPETGFDCEGCWSGSVIEHEGKLVLVYTGVDGVKAGIALAFSDDGIHFTKHPGNPVIPHPPTWGNYLDFRDPYVWREGDTFYLIVGAGVKELGGTALLYRCKDLINWEYRKQFLTGHSKSSGTFWEMPVFLKIGDHHVLIVSEVPGRASYWIGSWKDETFTPVDAAPRRLELFNHLLSPTPVIEPDGRVVVMGIIPEERSSKATFAAGWANLYSLPRVLTADANGLLSQKPHESVELLTKSWISVPTIQLDGQTVHAPEDISERSLRMQATFHRGESKTVSLLLRRASEGQEQTEILYDWESGRLTLERSQSSLDPTVKRDRLETAYLSAAKDSIHLDVFLDRSVLEVFIDNRATFAARIYPTLETSNGVAFASTGSGARVENVRIARIERTT